MKVWTITSFYTQERGLDSVDPWGRCFSTLELAQAAVLEYAKAEYRENADEDSGSEDELETFDDAIEFLSDCDEQITIHAAVVDYTEEKV